MQDMMRFEVLNEDMLHTGFGYVPHYNAGTLPSSQYWIEKLTNTYMKTIDELIIEIKQDKLNTTNENSIYN